MASKICRRPPREYYERTIVLRRALLRAVPCALVALFLKQLSTFEVVQNDEFMRNIAFFQVLNDSAAYSGFSLVLGFLVVFRTQMAYNRFWEGVSASHRMCAEWFDSSSSILAFTKISKADQYLKLTFERKYIKFLSLLHGVAVASLRDLHNLQLDEDDLQGLTPESIKDLQESPYPATVIFQWVQDITIQAMDDQVLSVPPPILSRVFHELANGMVAYHDCMKIQATNVPLPYKQMTKILMGAHWFITPVVMCMWTDWHTWTFIFTLIQSMIFWSLYFTAQQIEFPFQTGEISYSVSELHKEFNDNLLAMTQSKTGQVTSFQKDFDPTAWVHSMKTDIQVQKRKPKQLARRSGAVNIKEVQSPSSSKLAERYVNPRYDTDLERPIHLEIETPSVPQMDSGETLIETSGAHESEAFEPMADGRATVLFEREPNENGPSTDTHINISSRRQLSSLSRQQPTNPKSIAGERFSSRQGAAHELPDNSSLHEPQGSLHHALKGSGHMV